jgi:glucose/mannose-6-phosphate isomerase
MFGVLYETLVRAGLLQAVEPLQSLADWLLSLDLEDEGRDVAAWLGSRIPVVYSTPAYESGVARTWRIKFNENSKVPALAGALPEANHNEMIAFTPQLADQYAFLLLPSPDAHPRILRRFHLFAETLEHTGYPVRSLPMKGENPLRRALSSLLLADWTSYYLARDHGLDPIGIPAIQDFKAKL